MKQIGIALHNYHDTARSFPPAVIWGRPSHLIRPQWAYHHTWLTMILPGLEQQPLYDEMQPYLRAFDQPFVSHKVGSLLCPSDANFKDPIETYNMAITNYVANEGYDWFWGRNFSSSSWPAVNVPEIWDRVLANREWYGVFDARFSNVHDIPHTTIAATMADISDGTSSTVMVSESYSYGFARGKGFTTPVWNLYTSGTGIPRIKANSVTRIAFVAFGYEGICCYDDNYNLPDDSAIAQPTTWFENSDIPAGSPRPFTPTYQARYGPNAEWPGASSNHPGLVNVLLADGSVRSVQENIAWDTWMQVHGIKDGAIPEEFEK
jgi:prepilin-type processing-associated H-X9-DG protein